MKFVRQNKESDKMINIELCETINKTTLNANEEQSFHITFEFKDTFDTWNYEKESDRDLQFKYICELANVQTFGG